MQRDLRPQDENERGNGDGENEHRSESVAAKNGGNWHGEMYRNGAEQRTFSESESLQAPHRNAVMSPQRELRQAWRRLRRAPVFSLTTLIVLALGIGATIAMFSVVDGVLLRPLPFAEPDRLISLSHGLVVPGVAHVDQSDATFLLYQRHNQVFDGMGSYREGEVNIGAQATGGVDAQRVPAVAVSASLMRVLGVAPLIGRSFVAGEDRADAPPVVMLSERFWRLKFGADRGVVGSRVLIDGLPAQVVGVMPATFQFPSALDDVWYPSRFDLRRTQPGSFNYLAVARLRRGVSLEAAIADLDRILPRLLDEFPSDIPPAMFAKVHLHTLARPLRDVLVADASRLLWILFGAGALVLLIACANAANLFLVRGESRQRELTLRVALGASGGDVLAQYLSEAACLAALGGLLGLIAADWGVRLLASLPDGVSVPRVGEISVNARVVAFATLVTFLSAIAVSIIPVMRARRIPLVAALNDAGRAATTGVARQRSRMILVVAQTALALVLVAASGLMLRSFARLRDVAPGFNADGRVTMRMALPQARYGTAAAHVQYFERVLAAVRALPGVQDVGLTNWLPLSDGHDNTALAVEDHPVAKNTVPPIHDVVTASPSYFSALGIPMSSGRTFGPQDAARPVNEAVVSRAFAKRYWGERSALGKRLRPGIDGPWYTIVGVVGDVHLESLEKPAEDAAYLPLVTAGHDSGSYVPSDLTLVVHLAGDIAAGTSLIRNAVRHVDPTIPTFHEQTMSRVLVNASARTRFVMLLLGVAGSVALTLAGVGIYGVMAYGVSLRQREIGVRVALGARPSDVRRMISRQGVALAALGIAVGLVAALGLTRFMRGLLYGVSATDPFALAASCVLMLLVALAASWLPAHRAAAVDPATSLRAD